VAGYVLSGEKQGEEGVVSGVFINDIFENWYRMEYKEL
jgi:hypothetical protein